MEDNITQEHKITNNEIWHKLDMLIQQQNGCNKDLLDGIASLRTITEKHGKTIYGNGEKGLCEQARLNAAAITETKEEAKVARASIRGLIFAAAAFILIEVIKII